MLEMYRHLLTPDLSTFITPRGTSKHSDTADTHSPSEPEISPSNETDFKSIPLEMPMNLTNDTKNPRSWYL
jgi:hypothetical protein